MIVKAMLSIVMWGAAAIGFLRGHLKIWERVWAFLAAAMMLATYQFSDEIGFAACIAFLLWHLWNTRAPRLKAA